MLIKDVRQLVKKARKRRVNRAYYDKYFDIVDLHRAGLIQDHPAKTRLDLVELNNRNRNEFIHLYGFDHKRSSYFTLKLSIVSLYPDGVTGPPSKWRLANVELLLALESEDTGALVRYSYAHEQLVDYDEKQGASEKHENSNTYKIGSLSLETVSPFSLSRLLFNGQMSVNEEQGKDHLEEREEQEEKTATCHTRPIRLSISCHPTCDKFDYQYTFDTEFISSTICNSMKQHQQRAGGGECSKQEASRLLGLALEDRFDQPLMFEGHLQDLSIRDKEMTSNDECIFFMWGAKVKKFLEVTGCDDVQEEEETRDCLFAWSECGQQIHLTRPKSHPDLVYGFAHSSHDYASPLNGVQLNTGDDEMMPFSKLSSFSSLTTASSNHKIKARAFQVKDFEIEFFKEEEEDERKNCSPASPIIKIQINGFKGRALTSCIDFGEQIKRAQEKLLVMGIRGNEQGFQNYKLADERLLGGKGNSLVQLARLVHHDEEGRLVPSPTRAGECSVPRGVIVTTKAYEIWLASEPAIADALRNLDATRRVLAARSSALHLDPLDRDHLSAARAQSELREQCATTRAKLINCPLPAGIARRIRKDLIEIFGKTALVDDDDERMQPEESGEQDQLKLMTFAVRSSCVGEDSLETSAAGQMKTLLDVRGLSSIYRAVVECWLSQFELEPLTYKSQNGLRFNLPMAVVVQELIPCYVAGVAATCDPLTGNKMRLEITANYGLGEGVVAGKQTDTVRVELKEFAWDARLDDVKQESIRHAMEDVGPESISWDIIHGVSSTTTTSTDGGECCLKGEQIRALAHLLLQLRRASELRERELEWGITLLAAEQSNSELSHHHHHHHRPAFAIHLLQSRPLTHLQRLSGRETRHELDYGLPCPLDLVSRANLGEVMPGALCPMFLSWLMPVTTSYMSRNPCEEIHSRCPYAADNMAYHAQMAVSMITYSDTAKRLVVSDDAARSKESQAIMYSMIGTTLEEDLLGPGGRPGFERFCCQKMNPLKRDSFKMDLKILLAIDVAIYPTVELKLKRELNKSRLTEDLIPLEDLFKRMRGGGDGGGQAANDLILGQQIRKLYERLTTHVELIAFAWLRHILASLTSVAFNIVCMKMLNEQPQHKGASLISPEVLNDFTVLLRGDPNKRSKKKNGGANNNNNKQTESGDISRLLEQLLESFVEENQVERMRAMQTSELYAFLREPANANLKSCRLFANFMDKNGHRAFKEFCLSTHTWADKPSSIVKLLAARLKRYSPEEADRERERRDEQERVQGANLARVLAKIEHNKLALLKWALPRARNNTIRREGSKSMLVRVIHRYRLAFRHLGGLLCLAGLLPAADLIFQLTIEELNEIVVRGCCGSPETDAAARDHLMPRLLYKARRRQQQARLLDKVTMPRPTLPLAELIKVMQEQTSESGAGSQHQQQQQQAGVNSGVRGLISCGGCVTGRACVISSLDEAEDQIEPNDILITYSIDISWSVYFYSLSGIVTEVGGIVSHGAVVAREYGLPTLCTAVGACSQFKTGQMVTLDANKGICYLAETSE